MAKRRTTLIVVVLVAGGSLLGGCDASGAGSTPTPGASGAPGSAQNPVAVGVGLRGCGAGWTGGRAGTWTFRVTNTSVAGTDVYVADASDDPATARVYAEVEALGAGASADVAVRLTGGDYRLVCLPADEDPVLGPVEHVDGAVTDPTPGIVPITQADLVPATLSYEAWVKLHLATLQTQVRALDTDVRRGDLAQAHTDWLTAHSTYGTLGGAYDAFGDLGDAIDGLPAAGTTALGDRKLTGFRRAEALLWSDASGTTIEPVTSALVSDVTHLRREFATSQIDTADLGIRAHEILENSLQVQLRGVADGTSGTTLAEVAANVAGAREPLDALRPLLVDRGVDLAPIDRSLDALAATLKSYDHDGRWTSRTDLTTAQRERLDAQVDECVELLANVAALTDPRRAL